MSGMPSGSRESCIVIENARIGGEGLGSIVLGSDGTILPAAQGDVRTLDAGGRVIVPAFAEPHAHLDRAFSQAITGTNQSGTLLEAIRRFRSSVGLMLVDALASGATRALTMLAANGVAYVRTHTIVGGEIGFRAWEAVELAASAVPAVRVQQVMMPLGGLVDRPNAVAWATEAAARGAVALGGAPWLADDPRKATRVAAEMAAELGIGLDLHVDETDDPSVSTLTDLAEAVNDADLGGRAVAAHCCSMASRPIAVARREAEALAQAGMAVVVCPVSSLSLQGRRTGLRGLAPVRLLWEASVAVGIGLDNIRDVVVGVGTADPLRAAWLLALAGHLTGEEDLSRLGETVVRDNRVICGMQEGLSPGSPADLLVIDATSLAEAIALVPARQRLFSGMSLEENLMTAT
jgi:cytosine deaminase